MGVMSCYRKGCESIMCDTYIYEIGYVCNDCQSEFKEYLEQFGKTNITEGELKRELKEFMESYKNDYTKGERINVEDFFDQYRD